MNLKSAAILIPALLFTQNLFAEILFEGFYRIERKGKHVGYLIERLSQDPKAKTKTKTSYMRIKQGDKEVYESLASTAKAGSGEPLKSVYLSSNTGPTLRTTTDFKGGVPHYTTEVNSADNPKHFKTGMKSTMMSSMVYFMTDLAKMTPHTNYSYKAYDEQSGSTDGAHLYFIEQQKVGGIPVYQFVNDSAGQPVENFVTAAGEPLATRAILGDSVAYWVADRAEATGLLEFPVQQITKIFGDLPEGKKNSWSAIPKFKAENAVAEFKKASDPRRPAGGVGPKDAKLPGRSL